MARDTPETPKRRGRKPREKTYSIHPEEPVETPDDQENFILHLPVSTEEADALTTFGESFLTQEAGLIRLPGPYDPDIDCGALLEVSKPPRTAEFRDANRVVRNLLYDIEGEHYPSSTSIKCWWCSHSFDVCPIGLPIKHEEGRFSAVGIFCSYNCACSFLFSENLYQDRLWHCYSLLNDLYKKSHEGLSQKIRLAPPKQALKIFGGYMDIEDFRHSNLRNDRAFRMLLPPMTMVIPQVEETTLKPDNTPIPVNKYKMQVATESLKLRRSKPILDHRKTLSNYISINKVNTPTPC